MQCINENIVHAHPLLVKVLTIQEKNEKERVIWI